MASSRARAAALALALGIASLTSATPDSLPLTSFDTPDPLSLTSSFDTLAPLAAAKKEELGAKKASVALGVAAAVKDAIASKKASTKLAIGQVAAFAKERAQEKADRAAAIGAAIPGVQEKMDKVGLLAAALTPSAGGEVPEGKVTVEEWLALVGTTLGQSAIDGVEIVHQALEKATGMVPEEIGEGLRLMAAADPTGVSTAIASARDSACAALTSGVGTPEATAVCDAAMRLALAKLVVEGIKKKKAKGAAVLAPPAFCAVNPDGAVVPGTIIWRGAVPLETLQELEPSGGFNGGDEPVTTGYSAADFVMCSHGRPVTATAAIPLEPRSPGGYQLVVIAPPDTGVSDLCQLPGGFPGAAANITDEMWADVFGRTGLAASYASRGVMAIAPSYPTDSAYHPNYQVSRRSLLTKKKKGAGIPPLPHVPEVEGPLLVDAARAARAVLADAALPATWGLHGVRFFALSGRTVFAGLGQGGHAALAAAHYASIPGVAEDVRVCGTAAAAPFSGYPITLTDIASADNVALNAMLVFSWRRRYARANGSNPF